MSKKGTGSVRSEIRDRLDAISDAAERSPDIADLEPLLLDLLDYLSSVGASQQEAEATLIELLDTWPWGALEALEFTMRTLQWDAVRQALENQLNSDADFRLKDQARHVLEVFEREWPGGEVYATYRSDDSG
jgi:hypothetical protein